VLGESRYHKKRLGHASHHRTARIHLPQGRKRAGWKKEFLDALSEAAKDIGEISEEEIQRTVPGYREERQMPEITVAAEV
jgi:hypothetical protein